MAARALPERTEGAKVFPFERRKRSGRHVAGRRVIAVVLDDGTIRELGGNGPSDEEPFRSGQLSGDRWILWWERRDFD